MRIVISRKLDPLSFGQATRIFVNGSPTIQLAQGQGVEMKLNLEGQKTAILSVKEIQRTSIVVEDGDHILLERSPLYATLGIGGLAILAASFIFQFSTAYALPLLISSFLVKQYKLSKIKKTGF